MGEVLHAVEKNTFSGTIDRVRLMDLVQLACLAQFEGALSVQSESGEGAIYTRSGQIYHAQTESLEGEEAFHAMLAWRNGRFETLPPREGIAASISTSWEYLIIESLRLFQQSQGEAGALSSAEAFSQGFSGVLSSVQLSDLIQLACLAKTNHQIAVEGDRGAGTIWVCGGAVCHAEVAGQTGEDAFFEMFKWKSGRFEASAVRGEVAETISMPAEYLLMEAMRIRDEAQGEAEEGAGESETLFQKIQKLKMAEKIRLALLGDKESRGILARDSSRVIQLAIISNPRITESEVALIAYSRNMDEEVLRKIANSREWMKLYPIRLALVKNPKTPVPISTRLVQTLLLQDWKVLARSKGIPSEVVQAARKQLRKQNGS